MFFWLILKCFYTLSCQVFAQILFLRGLKQTKQAGVCLCLTGLSKDMDMPGNDNFYSYQARSASNGTVKHVVICLNKIKQHV